MYFWRTSSSTGEGLYMSLGEDYGLQGKILTDEWVLMLKKQIEVGRMTSCKLNDIHEKVSLKSISVAVAIPLSNPQNKRSPGWLPFMLRPCSQNLHNVNHAFMTVGPPSDGPAPMRPWFWDYELGVGSFCGLVVAVIHKSGGEGRFRCQEWYFATASFALERFKTDSQVRSSGG